jgi:DNA processing protein
LRELERPPEVIYAVGDLPRGPSVGIVGTRHPTAAAVEFAQQLARELARRDVIVHSGGAQGIDTAAHRGALEGGGRTVVVAPSSFDRPFPEENDRLFREIVEAGGAFITTHPPGTAAARHHFFHRNLVLACLVDVLVVVESRFRGGARNAAKAARALGRKVLVVPGAPWNDKAAGCLLELRNGAGMVTSFTDVLAALGTGETGAAEAVAVERPDGQLSLWSPDEEPDPDRRSVLSALQKGPCDADMLCTQTGLAPARLQALLLTLTLEGIVVSQPSGLISRVTC